MTINIPYDTDNVFNLDQPESWGCVAIWGASVQGDTPLLIRLQRGESDVQYIKFYHPVYFSGNVLWHGANFRTGSEHELIKHVDYGFVTLNQTENFRLYVVDVDPQPIKIIAQESYLIQQAPRIERENDRALLDRIIEDDGTAFLEKPFAYRQDGDVVEGWHYLSVLQVLDYLSDGFRVTDIMAMYEWLDTNDIRACLLYARRAMRD